jgi:signal transduction histidine kinase
VSATTAEDRGRSTTVAVNTQAREPLALRVLEWSTTVPAVASLMGLLFLRETWRTVPPGEALLWISIIAACDLLPVRLPHNLVLAMSLPIVLAASFVYPPEIAAGIAFVGSLDMREFRREISVAHGLFNRSQVAVSAATASLVFHAFRTPLSSWPQVLMVAMLALAADVLVNWTLVYIGLRTIERADVRSLLSNLSAGNPIAFFSAYIAFGLIAVLLALAVDTGGTWGLVAVGIPILLARQVFVRSIELYDTARMLADKSRVLLAITEKVADERRDERLAIAAALHDDLLPPVYKVHLLGQVIRQDLATGQLLALDDDVPDLVSATQHTADVARNLIRRLRASPIGADGLTSTLGLLARTISTESNARIHAQLVDCGGSPIVQLLAYQVAREALRNAVKYSSARNIWLQLEPGAEEVRLTIEDDGVGFEPSQVDQESHFGLQLMRERVELVGGIFRVDTAPGGGTRIVVRLPSSLLPFHYGPEA